jgi:triacylglycerol esterase/lipase EstA (alpha/beta hydrolase family)
VSRRRSAGRAQTAADLHTLVDRVHVPGPYVLAGHSFGGLYILAFAAEPLIVLTASRGHDAEWMAAQDKLATLSTNSEHRVIDDAAHESLLLVPTMPLQPLRLLARSSRRVRNSGPLN